MSVIETGSFLICLGWIASVMQSLSHVIFPAEIRLKLSKRLAVVTSLTVIVAFFILTYGYVTSDFSVLNISENSHTDKPLFYKIVGVWGNHEGSMLLWSVVLSLYGMAMAKSSSFEHHDDLRIKSLSVQGFIGALILGFIIFTSNPFARIFPMPENGLGLNPLLQDAGLAFHPPLLYGGYVGFSAVFAIACGALWHGDMDKKIGHILRFWCLIAWISLTAGIGLGMWWAYYELGWGGFWFWDPVENASLMPWLAGTALLHSAIMLEKRGIMKSWTVLLAIFAFGASMLGTFIVRSGIIASVHSFAASPERGLVILGIFIITIGGALILYAMRSHLLRQESDYDLFSREGALILNNYLMCGILLIVFTGTLYPTILESVTGKQISVGAPYFNATVSPLIYVIGILCPLSGFMAWKKSAVNALKKPIFIMMSVTFGMGLMIFIWGYNILLLAKFLLIMGLWIMTGTMLEFILRGGLKNPALFFKYDSAKFTAHFAIGLLMIGVAGAGIMKQEKHFVMQDNHSYNMGTDRFKLIKNYTTTGENFSADNADILHENTGRIYTPQRYYFPVAKQMTTEADIHLNLLRDVYITIGALTDDKTRIVNIRIHPLVGFMWGAFLLVVMGGILRIIMMMKPFSKEKS
jgi:cytochrome c-type biogenesis protein CcmF